MWEKVFPRRRALRLRQYRDRNSAEVLLYWEKPTFSATDVGEISPAGGRSCRGQRQYSGTLDVYKNLSG